MKKFSLPILFTVLLCTAVWGISADLGEVGVGARPLSLGRAYVGFSEDTSAIFTNPAGLRENKQFGLMSMTGKLLEDVTYVVVGANNTFPFGTIGVGYISAGTYGIPLTTLTQTQTETKIEQYGVTDYSSSILYFSLARDLNPNLFAGGNLKLFTQGFSQDSGSLEGGTGIGLDADFGLKWKIKKGVALGLVAQNILPSSLGGRFVWKNGFEEAIPAVIKLGSALKIWGDDGLYEFRGQKLLWNLDVEMNPQTTKPGLWHTGFEWWANPLLALRAGIDQKTKATENGVGIDSNFTGGVGFKYRGFSFDYAYHQYGDLTENTAHLFSIGFVGEPEPKKIAQNLKDKIQTGIKTEVKAPKALMEFNDVPDDYWAHDPIQYLATLGIVSGYPDDTYRPGQALSRAELSALLVKAKGFPVSAPKADLFSDVKTDNWAAPFIEVALNRKYVSGYPNKTFKPTKPVTRAEAIVVIAKFAGLSEPEFISYKPFPDVSAAHWAAPAIAVSKQAGLLEYLSGNKFEPDKPFTRAEAAEVISKTSFAKDKIKELLKK